MLELPPILAFFAHPWMLFWAVAAAAPLLIHLLNRRRYREQPWAAMEYLLAAMRKNVRRIRIEQWLLLALRTLLILALVAAVADPVLQGLGITNVAGVRTHRVFVLDGSYSMASRPDEETRFADAKRMIADIVEQSPQGDGYTLILQGAPSRPIVRTPAFAKREFLEELDAVALPQAGGDLAGALQQAAEIVQTARRDERRLARDEVYLVSDLGRTSWAPRDKSQVKRVRDTAQKLVADGASLVVVDVGPPDQDNVAITGLACLERVPTTRGEVAFEAQLRNFGREARPKQRVQFFVDDALIGEQSIDLPAGGEAAAAFRYRFDAPGDHAVEARIAGDRLEVDDHRWLSLAVKDRLRVLCVDGRPGSGGAAGAAEYLRVALAPSDEALESLAEVEVVTEGTWLESDLEAYDCIFLAEVRRFTEAEARALRSYLEAGGGLVTILGPRIDAANYNERLGGERAVLPAAVGEVTENAGQIIDPLGYRHAIVSPFRDQEQAGLLTTPIAKYFRLTPAIDRGARVAAAFADGDPWIVEAPVGRGTSVLVATSAADRDWTLWPVWPSFVPLVQEMLFASLQGTSEDRNSLVGAPLGGTLRGSVSEPRMTIQLPGGGKGQAKTTSDELGARWSFPETLVSGIYRIAGPTPTGAAPVFAVNVDTVEGDPAYVDEAYLRNELWPGLQFDVYSHVTAGATASSMSGGRGAAMHFGFLVAAIGLMFAESTLAWYFGARHA